RLPSVGVIASGYAAAGVLFFYTNSLAEELQRVGVYVDKILKGNKPADLPVEQPTKYELVINLKTAKALGLTIAPSLLLRADQIVECPSGLAGRRTRQWSGRLARLRSPPPLTANVRRRQPR